MSCLLLLQQCNSRVFLACLLLVLLSSGRSFHDPKTKEHHDWCTTELVRRVQEDVYTNLNMTANGFNDLLLPLYLNTYKIDKVRANCRYLYLPTSNF